MRQELAALVGTEFRLRLRSGATWVALAAFVAGFWFWLPSADGHSVNLSWRTIDGQLQTPFLTSRLVGIACGQLCGVILGLVGFYLIAGTVKGDARRGLGPILAATPLPSWTYLAGKSLAHAAYLATLAGFGVLTGILTLAVRSDAPIEPLHLVEPAIWTALPMALLVATLAILFDVTPGLRGAGGWVAWYFLFVGLMLALPVVTTIVRETRAPAEARVARPIVWDPTGIAGLTRLVTESLPEAARGTVSSGLVVHSEAPEKVEWPGVELSAGFRLQRLGTLLQALLPFGLAVLFFDRFDPSRRRGKRGGPEPAIVPARHAAERGPVDATTVHHRGLAALPPVVLAPSTLRSIAAEIRLTFEVLGRWRWLVLALALAPAVVPGIPLRLLLLLAATPILAVAGAREAQSGTTALLRAQPGLPLSLVLWKSAGMSGFAVLLVAPTALRLASSAPLAAASAVVGAALLGCFAAACGALTGGAKLFAVLQLTGLYLALNGLPGGDVTGLLRMPGVVAAGPFALGLFALLVAATGAAALALERRRPGQR
ncbi:MAG: ABC transporter permease [Thermoanaerobaculia bacterium]